MLLPEGQGVTLEFFPDMPGEYGFHCRMEILRSEWSLSRTVKATSAAISLHSLLPG